ncbi:sugar phosphate isomerase family [Rubripirellula reticaptiva]|uniref:Glucosamine-6-phosphate deaminase n=1 Tax=Rubripirellula reticaptiva TaxID=2528013 RepID=A0A5C6FF08_9BACT|nr:glucosamine-6-phosphate isomerase [Rubripirellula reticaptiva]TWU58209.1 glucosamine-6-phosphate deaminase [Rubripirellula reticaptiva]
MSRPISKVAPGWWDYTTLDESLLADAAKLTAEDVAQLSRPGFSVRVIDTAEEFYLAEALEYINAWRRSTADRPTGICGPIGPTEQLPLVARLVNELEIDIRDAHFWGMDEWVDEIGKPVPAEHPLSFAKADMQMCFDKIHPRLCMPKSHLHFPTGDLDAYSKSFDQIDCLVMQGGQGEVKHWAFNDPPKREGDFVDAPPSAAEYRELAARVTDLHPMTIIQNARTSGGGQVALVPTQAATVGPVETWKSKRVSIWHGGQHDNPFGIRLTSLMISKGIADSSVPMSLLADHGDVQFTFLRSGIGVCETEMH